MKAATAKKVSPPWDLEIKRKIQVRARTEIVDAATGIAVKTSPWIENLAFDIALSYIVSGNPTNTADIFAHCKIGSGTNPNSIAGGTTTFTQVGTTITASAGFFTSAMVGGIHKYGTGSAGAEQYIASIGGGGLTCVVLGAGMSVGTPTVGTVWRVQQTALQTYLAKSTSYQTNAGDNSTVIAGASITMQRTFIFATPGSTQNINEIGYSENNTNDGSCRGRIVLPSTDVVDTTHFYRVVMQLFFNVAPVAPTAVGNGGTNINTAGNVMFEYYDFVAVLANGQQQSYQNNQGSDGYGFMDGNQVGPFFLLRTASWSQPGATQTRPAPGDPAPYSISIAGFATAGQPLGSSLSTTSFSLTTAGETITGFVIAGNGPTTIWTLKLTTPFTLPVGTFQGSLSIKKVFMRTLTN